MAGHGQASLRERRQGMSDSDMRQRAGRSDRAGGPVSDLLRSKLRCPLMRPGTVPRSLLIERLARVDSRPVMSVVAPPGYGKTTLLSQSWRAVREICPSPARRRRRYCATPR